MSKQFDIKVVKIHDVQIDNDYAQWFNEIKSAEKLAQLGRELQYSGNQSNIKLTQGVGEFENTDFPSLFAYVPWGHHSEIIAKCKNKRKAVNLVPKI